MKAELGTIRIRHNGKTAVKIQFFKGKYSASTKTSHEIFENIDDAKAYANWYVKTIYAYNF